MLEAHTITHLHEGDSFLEVVVTFEQRQKSRYKTQTTCGKDLGWFVERGRVLNGHDALKCSDGTLIKIICAEEPVSQVKTEDTHLLMRVAYHLGNRHVPLQVDAGLLSYQQDYVLDDMVKGLGLDVIHCQAPFHPESGAYAGAGHTHAHDDGDHHNHGHSHSHAH